MFRISDGMNEISRAIESIDAKAKAIGLPELARRSGVAYTTLIDLQKRGFRPRSVAILEKLAEAANADVEERRAA